MNRNVFLALALVAIVALVFVLIPRRPAATAAPGGGFTSVTVPPRELHGDVIVPPASGPVRVAFTANGSPVADVPVKDGKFAVTLPAKLEEVPLKPAAGIELPHGYQHLRGDASGAVVTPVIYEDANKNGAYDPGEPQLKGMLFRHAQNQDLRAFFRNDLVLLDRPAALKGSFDAPSGAKNFYRYDLDLPAGWNVVEGELGSNGYDIRAATGDTFDLVVPIPAGGGKGPTTFSPE